MEKLIELLNEWERERVNHNTKEYIKRGKNSFTRLGIIEVISKSYGFIEWLAENDKIDFNFVERIGSGDFIYNMDSPYYNSCTCEDLKEYNDVDRVLMQLSIQDEPIEFLISILK